MGNSKLKYVYGLAALVGFLLPMKLYSQTLILNGQINSTSKLELTAPTAGDNPLNLNLFNSATPDYETNTSQSVSYKWPYKPLQSDDPNARLSGNISVSTDINYDQIPSCFVWTIEATVPSSLLGNYGSSPNPSVITLGPTKQIIVASIWSTYSWVWLGSNSNRTANLTQKLLLTSSFADIHPTTNSDFITVRVSYEFY